MAPPASTRISGRMKRVGNMAAQLEGMKDLVQRMLTAELESVVLHGRTGEQQASTPPLLFRIRGRRSRLPSTSTARFMIVRVKRCICNVYCIKENINISEVQYTPKKNILLF